MSLHRLGITDNYVRKTCWPISKVELNRYIIGIAEPAGSHVLIPQLAAAPSSQQPPQNSENKLHVAMRVDNIV